MKTCLHLDLILSLIFLTSYASPQMPVNHRDMAKYENGGSFKFGRTVSQSDQNTERSKIREFVWDHWAKKRSGRISLIFWSDAEDPSTYDLYIEPDEKSIWGVTSVYERQCCIERTRQNPKIGIEINTGTLYYLALERREMIPGVGFNGEDMPLDTGVYGKPVRDWQKLGGKDFVLLFRKEKQGQSDWLL